MTAPVAASDDEVAVSTDWHRRPVDTVLAEFATSPDGLDDAAVDRRRAEFGTNELQESAGTSPLALIWGQISSVMVLILILIQMMIQLIMKIQRQLILLKIL